MSYVIKEIGTVFRALINCPYSYLVMFTSTRLLYLYKLRRIQPNNKPKTIRETRSLLFFCLNLLGIGLNNSLVNVILTSLFYLMRFVLILALFK